MKDNLMGFTRQNECTFEAITSTTNQFESRYGMVVKKEMVIRKIYIVKQNTVVGGYNDDFVDLIEDPEVKAFIKSGYFLTTDSSLPGAEESNISILMAHNYTNPRNKGRGGVLIKKDNKDKWEPITMKLFGKSFMLDLKGVGTPDGTLQIDEKGDVIGGHRDTPILEYNTLTAAMLEHPLFNQGLVPLPITHNYFGNCYGQVIRAIPTFMRPSYTSNSEMESLVELSDNEIALGLGQEIGRYLGFSIPHLGGNLSTDNLYIVPDNANQYVIATDFMEILPIHESLTPWFTLQGLLDNAAKCFPNCPGIIEIIFQGILLGIKELRPYLNFPLEDNMQFTPESLTRYLMKYYLAVEILKRRMDVGFEINLQAILNSLPDDEQADINFKGQFDASFELELYLEDELKILEVLEQGANSEYEGVIGYLSVVVRKLNERYKRFNNHYPRNIERFLKENVNVKYIKA